jgi:hypothetical protein
MKPFSGVFFDLFIERGIFIVRGIVICRVVVGRGIVGRESLISDPA